MPSRNNIVRYRSTLCEKHKTMPLSPPIMCSMAHQEDLLNSTQEVGGLILCVFAMPKKQDFQHT